MSLKDTINDKIKEAMKARDEAGLRALRAIKAAILLAETAEGHTGDLTSEEEMKLLMKQSKQRKESIEQFNANGRADLAKIEMDELAVIETFLPKALTPEALEAEIKTIIAESGATSAKDLGKVMGAANKKLAGLADGKAIAEIVKRLLA
jgi:uncharacterized protein